MVGHLFAVTLAFWLAFALRFELSLGSKEGVLFLHLVGVLCACRMLTLWYWGQFSGIWRYVTTKDMYNLLKANVAGSSLFIVVLLFWKGHAMDGLPRSILALEFMLSMGFMAGIRMLVRSYHEYVSMTTNTPPGQVRKTLIVGTGARGVGLAREGMVNPLLGMRLIGFLDDDSAKRGRQVMGVPVLGGTDQIEQIIGNFGIEQVIVALPGNVPTKVLRGLQEACAKSRVNCRVLRPSRELATNQPLDIRLREISAKDVMDREVICFDEEITFSNLASKEGQVILVSGAAGSIGSELCRQLAVLSPKKLVLLDQSESGLYDIQQELRRKVPTLNLSVVVGDICDERKVKTVFRRFQPDLVYHAAAYKHVPLMEDEPLEAVRANVLGSYYLGQAAQSVGCRRFVFISTDKAVNPVSVMGMTKLTAERILSSFNLGGCRFMSVRFGNVLNSNGSVIPLFRRQVAEGGPVTVTHPEVTRFFMATEEAVNLVMTAGDIGRGGEVFLLDMGQPEKIMDLARKVILLAGLEPERDIEIRVTGLRPGEKLHEELFWQAEGVEDTAHPKIKSHLKPILPASEALEWVRQFHEAVERDDPILARKLLKEFADLSLEKIPPRPVPAHDGEDPRIKSIQLVPKQRKVVQGTIINAVNLLATDTIKEPEAVN